MQRFLEEDSKEDLLAYLRNIDNHFLTTKEHELSKSNNVEKKYYADLVGVGSQFCKEANWNTEQASGAGICPPHPAWLVTNRL